MSWKSTLKGFKNQALASKRMRPELFIAGFQKCGTTSLYDYLVQLPQVLPGEVKEKNDLSSEDFSLANYLANFPMREEGKITICGSHQLTYFPLGLPRVKEHFPESRIILIMRDPVERAYSLYQHNSRVSDDDSKTFEKWVEVEFDIIKSIRDLSDIEEVFEKTKWRGREPGSWDIEHRFSTGMNITRGIYVNYVKRILDLGIPVYMLSLEGLTTDFEGEFGALLNWVGLEIKQGDFPVPQAKNSGGYKEWMKPETEQMLTDFFRPYNQELFELIGKEYSWRI